MPIAPIMAQPLSPLMGGGPSSGGGEVTAKMRA